MKNRWKTKRTIAVILAAFLLTTVSMPAAVFAEGDEATPVSETVLAENVQSVVEQAPEAIPAETTADHQPETDGTDVSAVIPETEKAEESAATVDGSDAAAVETGVAEETGVPDAETATAEASDADAAVSEQAAESTEIPASEQGAESTEIPAEQTVSAETEQTSGGGFYVQTPQAGTASAASEEQRKVEIQVGDHIITATGSFPEGTEIQAVAIPGDAAAKMAGKAALFAYDIRLVVDGETWQPEDHGTDVQVSVRSLKEDMKDVIVDLLHVRTNLLDDAGALSQDALNEALQKMTDGSADSEMIGTEAGESGFSFETSSFSPYVGTTNSRIVYVYNATLFNNDSANYAGVYSTKLAPNSASAEEAKTTQTIGIESIADGNLPDKPTTESPAIIQGAAVGYDKRLGPTEFELIDPNRPRPEPYSEFKVKVLEEKGADGTIHKKPSGFDGTYVIVRLDVSEFFSAGSDNLYLHMEQKDNKALMAAATAAKGTANAKPEDYTPVNMFTDGLGNRSASYKLSDLVDPNGSVPYVDVIVFATAANVAGADTASNVKGDIPLAFYVDNQLQYNDALVEYDPNNSANVNPNDPNAATAYTNKWHAKFFDAAKAAANTVSHFLVKGSDLALETMVENTGGADGTETTYWSLKKSMENPYYDQEIDKNPNDPGSGRTVKLMSEVAVTNGLTLEGSSANELKKRTLDVNSYDIQVANNSGKEGQAAEDISLKNAWLTIADYSNTTGAEMAIGNNAQFVIDQGGKLIIDETCQLEIEWDGATTTPAADGTTPEKKEVLNNGQLDLRAGGEIINNGIITIEGTEGKPIQPGTGQQQNNSEKGRGEMTIREGATLTNNGALVVYGILTNRGTLVNNGKYNDVIKSNDPDKGLFDYHKGIQVAWKDDVTQQNVEPGSLINEVSGTLINNGDIVLTPGTLDNRGKLVNASGANIYSATATEAIIPITPDPKTPTIVTKRIKLNPVKLSNIINSGTLVNIGSIAPASVALLDNTGGFSTLTSPGAHPELFSVRNSGTIYNYGFIYNMYKGNIVNTGVIYNLAGRSTAGLVAALVGSVEAADDLWLYLYEDDTFLMKLPNGEELTGTYEITDDKLVFTFADGTVAEPEVDEAGDLAYSITTETGYSLEFVLTADFIKEVQASREAMSK